MEGKGTCILLESQAFLEADDSVLNADWPNLVERSNLYFTGKNNRFPFLDILGY